MLVSMILLDWRDQCACFGVLLKDMFIAIGIPKVEF